jgi:hypothetical protein
LLDQYLSNKGFNYSPLCFKNLFFFLSVKQRLLRKAKKGIEAFLSIKKNTKQSWPVILELFYTKKSFNTFFGLSKEPLFDRKKKEEIFETKRAIIESFV